MLVYHWLVRFDIAPGSAQPHKGNTIQDRTSGSFVHEHDVTAHASGIGGHDLDAAANRQIK